MSCFSWKQKYSGKETVTVMWKNYFKALLKSSQNTNKDIFVQDLNKEKHFKDTLHAN